MDEWTLFQQSLTVQPPEQDTWDPGFEGERRIVVSRLGPYFRLFYRPGKFVNRFYHKVYNLTIGNWEISAKTRLYGGFCTIHTTLNVRFQPTLRYIEENLEALTDTASHIKANYEGLIRDEIDTALVTLDDGNWIETGLTDVEKGIETAINETLMLQNIQCRTLCNLEPSFKPLGDNEDMLDGKFIQESMYTSVLKRNFEFRTNQNQEKFRQEQSLERARLEHKEKMLEQLRREEEIQRQKQAQKAEGKILKLQEEGQQRASQYDIEEQLRIEKLKHKTRLSEMDLQAEIAEQSKMQAERLRVEKNLHSEKVAHDAQLRKLELKIQQEEDSIQQAEKLRREEAARLEKLKQESRLKEIELKAEIEEHAKQQAEWHRVEEHLRAEKLKHESRLKQMELETEIMEHQKRFEATQKTDNYLRREIETLVLEKQRAELDKEIKQAGSRGLDAENRTE